VVKDEDRSWFEPLVLTFSHPALKYGQILVLNTDISLEIVQEAFGPGPGFAQDTLSGQPVQGPCSPLY
jgi:hypothetical protein